MENLLSLEFLPLECSEDKSPSVFAASSVVAKKIRLGHKIFFTCHTIKPCRSRVDALPRTSKGIHDRRICFSRAEKSKRGRELEGRQAFQDEMYSKHTILNVDGYWSTSLISADSF